MKRALLGLALLTALPAAAFALIDVTLAPATPLVWYEAHGPAGSLAVFSGYSSITGASTNIAAGQRMFQRIKPLRLSFTTTTVGVGAGTYTYEAFDTTSAASICVSGAVACTAGLGVASVDCLGSGTATANPADDVVLRVNGAACGTSPTGTVALEYTQVLADEGVDFLPRFTPLGQWGLDGGGNFFGLDAYHFDTITCGWSQAGVVSGATDVMRVQLIQKSDAGVLCTCDLPGACNDVALSEHTCSCSGGRKFLTNIVPLGQGYAIQLNSATNCGFNPQGLVCGIPFHR